MIRLIALRELRARVSELSWWVILAGICAALAWLMFAQIEVYQQIAPQLQASGALLGINDLIVAPTLNSLSLLLLLLTPLLYAQALTEERASARLAVLSASLGGVSRLLLGKWLGNSCAAWLMLLLALALPASLQFGAEVHWQRLLTASLGLAMLVGLLGAITLMCAAFSRHTAAALAATYGLILLLWLLDSLLDPHTAGFVLALNPPLGRSIAGRLDSAQIAYFVLLSASALLIAWARLHLDRASQLSHTLRGRLRLGLFALLLPTCLGFGLALAQRAPVVVLSAQTKPPMVLLQALAALEGPLQITVYAAEAPLLRARLEKLLQPLREYYPRSEVRYVDPAKQPQLARALGINQQGEVSFEAMGRHEHMAKPTPANLLRAIGRLARQGEPWIVSLETPVANAGTAATAQASFADTGLAGMSAFAGAAEQLGFGTFTLDAHMIDQLPDNTAVLLLQGAPDSPRTGQLLRQHLQQGGQVLWLLEEALQSDLLEQLGVQFAAQLPGAREAHLEVPGTASPSSQVARFDSPTSLRLRPTSEPGWQIAGRLVESSRKPIEADSVNSLGLLLQRQDAKLALIGDSDFARNSLFARPGNRAVTLGLLNWLTDNRLATAPPRDDLDLRWSAQQAALLGLLQMFALPGILLLLGWRIQRHRRGV